MELGDVRIEPLDLGALDHAAMARINGYFNALKAEARPEDPSTPVEETEAFLSNIPRFIEVHAWAGFDDDGEMVCGAQGIAIPDGENDHILQCDMGVLGPFRRRGIGTALVGLLVGAAERTGKKLLTGTTNERVGSGAAFCLGLNATPGLNTHVNRLELSEVDWHQVARWVAEGPARGSDYELLGFDGRCPDELIRSVVDVLDVMNDAPRDDLEVGDNHWTVDTYRQMEQMSLAQGSQPWRLYARERSTGRLVGLTEVDWSPNNPTTIFQGNTGVHPDHRGHALGKWLKATMLERIRTERPEAVEIRTGNADSNDAMLAINHALGFRPYIASTTWQVSPETLRERLASR